MYALWDASLSEACEHYGAVMLATVEKHELRVGSTKRLELTLAYVWPAEFI